MISSKYYCIRTLYYSFGAISWILDKRDISASITKKNEISTVINKKKRRKENNIVMLETKAAIELTEINIEMMAYVQMQTCTCWNKKFYLSNQECSKCHCLFNINGSRSN